MMSDRDVIFESTWTDYFETSDTVLPGGPSSTVHSTVSTAASYLCDAARLFLLPFFYRCQRLYEEAFFIVTLKSTMFL